MANSQKAPVDGTAELEAFMAELEHPRKADIAAVRKIIREAGADITEEIKWNAPGFRTTESFATVNLRSTEALQLIFHLGAKVRPGFKGMKIADPAGLVKWLGKDRAMVTVGAGKSVAANAEALQALVREWVKFV